MDKAKRITIPGINIRWPWSDLILSGQKTIETRSYPIPLKYINMPMAVIETARHGNSGSGAKVVGVVVFSECFLYKSKDQWQRDRSRHLVENDDELFAFITGKEKWGWAIAAYCRAQKPLPPPQRRGIKYASNVKVPQALLSNLSF